MNTFLPHLRGLGHALARGAWSRAFLRAVFNSVRWRTRIVLWGAAGAAGLAAVAFARLSEWALSGLHGVLHGRVWLSLLLTPAVGMVVVWIVQRWCAATAGSGIPQTIAATRLLEEGQPVGHLISLRVAAAKMVLGAAALFGGYSAGREGPTVQIGASLMHAVHRWLPRGRLVRASDLALAGGAAGIAAAFNTPLAGITFAVEELGRRLEARTSGVLLGTIIVAGLTAIAVAGDYRYFGQLTVHAVGVGIVPAVLLGSVACGVLGGIFSRMLLWPQRSADSRLWRWRARRPVWFAGLCGLAVAAIGCATDGATLGSGYAVTAQAIVGGEPLPWYVALGRFFATLLTYYSGVPGGIFAPALAVGAAVGMNLSQWLDFGMTSHPLIAICMAGFLAAVTQSPITSAIIVMEMVDGHSMVISLMASALVAKAASSRFGPELYQQLSRAYLPMTSARAEERGNGG